MESAFELLRLNGLLRRAIRLIKGVYIRCVLRPILQCMQHSMMLEAAAFKVGTGCRLPPLRPPDLPVFGLCTKEDWAGGQVAANTS